MRSFAKETSRASMSLGVSFLTHNRKICLYNTFRWATSTRKLSQIASSLSPVSPCHGRARWASELSESTCPCNGLYVKCPHRVMNLGCYTGLGGEGVELLDGRGSRIEVGHGGGEGVSPSGLIIQPCSGSSLCFPIE